jgi:chorismate mutase
LYGGACGYLSYAGDMDVAIAIRTGIIKNQTLYVQAAAGVVADSVPELEWKETEAKARALVARGRTGRGGIGMNQHLLTRCNYCTSMTEVRRCVDALDDVLVPLLVQRTAYMTQAARIKQDKNQVRDEARIETIVDRVRKQAVAQGGEPRSSRPFTAA